MLERSGLQNGTNAVQAGIVFVGCGMAAFGEDRPPFQLAQGQSAAASKPAGAARRREVVVNGRRVKTVDIHAHCAVPEANAVMGHKLQPALVDTAARIRAMDEQGIDIEALSINPFWYK